MHDHLHCWEMFAIKITQYLKKLFKQFKFSHFFNFYNDFLLCQTKPVPWFTLKTCLWASFRLLCSLFAYGEAYTTGKGVFISPLFSSAVDRYPGQTCSQTLGTSLVSQEVLIKTWIYIYIYMNKLKNWSFLSGKRNRPELMNFTKKRVFPSPFSLLFLTTPVNFFQPNTFFSALLTARIVNNG